MTTSDLTPKWQPLIMPGDCAPYPLEALPSTVIDDLAIIIAGGPAKLCVCHLNTSRGILFSIAAQVQITGYTVNDGTLYVQDGPVISAWNPSQTMLVGSPPQPQGVCFSAYNLATGTKSQAADGGALSADQLAAVYQLNPGAAANQATPPQLPNRTAWTALLATVLKMRATGGAGPFGPAQVWPVSLDELANYLRSVLDPDNSAPQATTPAAVPASGAPLLFSPPVVRKAQIDGAKGGMVFVIGTDGSIHALDDDLTFSTVSKFEPPALPRLALAEIPAPQDPSNISARLYYTSASGAINEVNASTIPPTLLGSWPMQGLAADSLLPLSFVDGQLWGSGNPGDGDAFLALPADAPTMPVLKVPNEGGPWTQYEVDAAEKLVLVANETGMRLKAYAPEANVKDRWGPLTPRLAGWLGFWPGTGTDVQPAAARLVLNVEEHASEASGNAAFNVFVANTVDAPSLQYASTYPPPPLAVGTGTLASGAFHGLARIGWVRSKPVIVHQTAYFLARETSPFDAVIAFLAPGATGNRPFDDFVASIKDAAPADAAQDLPPLPLRTDFPDALVAYSLGDLLATNVMPDANVQLKHLTNLTLGINITFTMTFSPPPIQGQNNYQVPNDLMLQIGNLPPIKVMLDASNSFRVDSKYAGLPATVLGFSLDPYIRYYGFASHMLMRRMKVVPNPSYSTCILDVDGNTNTIEIAFNYSS